MAANKDSNPAFTETIDWDEIAKTLLDDFKLATGFSTEKRKFYGKHSEDGRTWAESAARSASALAAVAAQARAQREENASKNFSIQK